MATLKRNDPCPCGSGKKYKKCCLKKLEVKSKFDLKDTRDFNELIPKIFDFSKQYDETIKPAYEEKTDVFERLPVADARAFSQLYFHWILFNRPVEQNGETVLARFLQENRKEYSAPFQEFLAAWDDLAPRIFYVPHSDAEYLALRDELSGKAQTIEKTPVSQAIESGQYLVGYLYATPAGPALGNDAISLPPKLAEAFIAEWHALTAESDDTQSFLTDYFGHALHLLSLLVMNGTELERAEHDEAILALVREKQEQAFLPLALQWRSFVAKKRPRVQKPEAYAAALEYWAGKHLDDSLAQSQKALAEKYAVSSSTISAKYKQLVEV
ncbi:SEC-C domain-containing protein [Paenalkalicoccus suaedae]|uniref:SEC-C domain-containing protein n=1 Tax=Paenalkalicoccus suaedae TaxID=2592382 RepID=A0A859FBP6_9BACI|nr:SEC-C domain-containing protein [Paenalkalicoccus suaedae]QKS70467.1 SEC-C domain-containing protein [Paenalkalicoccus suaedae]